MAIAAGYSYSLALKRDGTVWHWGDHEGSTVPVRMSALSTVAAIAAGGQGSLAIKRDTTIWSRAPSLPPRGAVDPRY